MDQAHGHHTDSPCDCSDGEEDSWGDALHDEVGEGLSSGVADEEDRQGDVVIVTFHVEVVFHFGESGVACGKVRE